MIILTIDLDWAPEAAVIETLDVLKEFTPTVFTTHTSKALCQYSVDIGLHPYFDSASSHGSTIEETVNYITGLPHTLKAYRCHRFQTSNLIDEAMVKAGMVLSSNVCTDLEVIAPFKNRLGILEVPIFMEDGGYLLRNHSLRLDNTLKQKLLSPGIKVLLIHPMHFALNSPSFTYMRAIKDNLSREEWNQLEDLKTLRSSKRGIRDLILDILSLPLEFGRMSSLIMRA